MIKLPIFTQYRTEASSQAFTYVLAYPTNPVFVSILTKDGDTAHKLYIVAAVKYNNHIHERQSYTATQHVRIEARHAI